MRLAAVPLLAACAAAPAPSSLPAGPDIDAAALMASASTPISIPPSPCASDGDCGYDPARAVCGADARYNKQPPIIDQGILCYCDAHDKRCATFRVRPVPCEGDDSCSVDPEPRPHPVAASPKLPHEKGKRCKDYLLSTTCERTNICTMHRLDCP